MTSVDAYKPAIATSLEATILRRKWDAAVKPSSPLPAYEEVMLGSLGRLADNLIVVERRGDVQKVLRYGRGLADWIGSDRNNTRVEDLTREFSGPLRHVLELATECGRPVTHHARRVRGGLVDTYEFLALPLSSRWGGEIAVAHIVPVGKPYNLVDMIFRSTEEGILALAAVADRSGQPFDFQIVALNSAAARWLGRSEDALRWSYLFEAGNGLATPAMRQHLLSALTTGRHQQFELAVTVDGRELHLSVGLAPAGDLISATLTDITGIREREESVRLLFDSNPVPMWLYDPETLRISAVNDAAVVHYGYSRDRIRGMSLTELWPESEREAYEYIARAAGQSFRSSGTVRHIRADGTQIEVLAYARRFDLSSQPAVLAAMIDVTERSRAEARVAYLAKHDALTDLPNRVLFLERLHSLLGEPQGVGRLHAVHCIDLDHFKDVNDTLGHPIGDALLRIVARRLQGQLDHKSMVARLGGDEFAVIQTDIADPGEASELAARLISVVGAPYEVHGHQLVIGASVGIALAPDDGEAPDVLLRNADLALYRAKSDGRSAARFFEPEMDRRVQTRRVLELDLRRALVSGEFELHYQPVVDLHEDRVIGFEALIRWKHPERGMVPPVEFIPLAEEIGLIGQLGEWVLKTACAEAAHWPDGLTVAVNLSPVQFRSRNVLNAVVAALASSGLPPGRLELEITESVLLVDSDVNLTTLHSLRDMGVRIAMDDFGTGYSSLSYLRSFPFDKIKIDRSFVNELAKRPDCLAIIQAVISLGRNLGISTTAEGVETDEQLDRLRAEGCDEVQGFLFSRPRPAAEIGELIAAARPKARVA